MTPIQRVGVVGAGVMGSGIAHWLALHGCEIALRDASAEALGRGMTMIRERFDREVRRGKIAANEAEASLERITTPGESAFERCDLVVEAIVEEVAAKRALFTRLAAAVPSDVVLASNTSALPIEEIAGHITHPERAIGIHFFNPVSRMRLVEVVVGPATSERCTERVLAFVKAMRKTPVVCRSSPGFLVTRVLFFYLNAAVRLWENGVSTLTIDEALRGFGWPMGPLRLLDEVGLDVSNLIFAELQHYFPERFAPSQSTSRLLKAGLRGRKGGSGRGFYRYDGSGEHVNDGETLKLGRLSVGRAADPGPQEIVRSLMAVMVEEAERCVTEGVVRSAEDVDFALSSGAGFPSARGGLLQWARESQSSQRGGSSG